MRRARLELLLGVAIDDTEVEKIFTGLGLTVESTDSGWRVTPPSFRFDIAIEADLIEEVARIYGYDRVPESTAIAETPLEAVTESSVHPDRAAATLVARDYQEAITYSFVDEKRNSLIAGADSPLILSNPISSEMSVMRSSLWPGLIDAASRNIARQQDRVRLFEIGRSYHGTLDTPEEVVRIAGLASGPALPEQWGSTAVNVDFFDIKADVLAILELTGEASSIRFAEVEHPALQPGQAAQVIRDGKTIGVLGKLHPTVQKAFDIKRSVFVFELDALAALSSSAPKAEAVSRFPAIRRDIAVLVGQDIRAAELLETIQEGKDDLIRDVKIFDVYTGPGIEAGLKSVALGLILQETSRTLTDQDADSAMAAAVQKLQEKFGAKLRD